MLSPAPNIHSPSPDPQPQTVRPQSQVSSLLALSPQVPNFKPSALLSKPKTLAPKVQTHPQVGPPARALTATSPALSTHSPAPWSRTPAPRAHLQPSLPPSSRESDAAPTASPPPARGAQLRRSLGSASRGPAPAPGRNPRPPSPPLRRPRRSLTFRGLRIRTGPGRSV